MSPWHFNFKKNCKFFHVAAAKTTWRSDAYDHYSVSLQRNFGSKGEPLSLSYVFRCKLRPDKHPVVVPPCSKTAEGTSNMLKGMNTCLQLQGISKKQPKDDASIPYSVAGHRALLAQRCATSGRPFNMVSDPDYLKEVQMLRPGTAAHSPNTISCDLNQIYLDMSIYVKNYFMVLYFFLSNKFKLLMKGQSLNSAIHLVLDGWTSPIVSSYLGLVVVWYQNGLIHRAILEFIRYG